jgi:hypothetical protein
MGLPVIGNLNGDPVEQIKKVAMKSFELRCRSHFKKLNTHILELV